MTKFVVYWEDPEDCDDETRTGFEEFANEQLMLEWANKAVKLTPSMTTRVFEVFQERKLKPRRVTTEFVLD